MPNASIFQQVARWGVGLAGLEVGEGRCVQCAQSVGGNATNIAVSCGDTNDSNITTHGCTCANQIIPVASTERRRVSEAGHWPDIKRFVRSTTGDDVDLTSARLRGDGGCLVVGRVCWIIDVENPRSRIDERIVLIVRGVDVSSPYVTGLTICRHEETLTPAQEKIHGKICAPSQERDSTLTRVPLRLGNNVHNQQTPSLSLQPNTYVNFRELWNIKVTEIDVVLLGRLSESTFNNVISKLRGDFNKSIGH